MFQKLLGTTPTLVCLNVDHVTYTIYALKLCSIVLSECSTLLHNVHNNNGKTFSIIICFTSLV